MKYLGLSTLQKLCAASGASNAFDIARVILPANFRRVFPETRLPDVYSAHFSASCQNIDHSKNLLFSRRLFPYPRPRRCLKFTQETTENYARASNTRSQAPDARLEHTASYWLYASRNRCVEKILRGTFFQQILHYVA